MNDNGSNSWGIAFSRISHLISVLGSHRNLTGVRRHDDFIFEADRTRQGDHLTIACMDEYSAGVEFVMKVLDAFPSVNVIYVGGNWNGYTEEALEFCKYRHIGIFRGAEIIPALFTDDFWNYDKLDADGNSTRGRGP
ncbi:MAG TPA: hypothetical protein VL460_01640 [Caulobacteraceae bacterium]|nr:hypothetical protein [Caulobacteraceae bacterium]